MKVCAVLTAAALAMTAPWSAVHAGPGEGPYLRSSPSTDAAAADGVTNAHWSSAEVGGGNGQLLEAFLKFKLDGVRMDSWGVQDIAAFDHAVQIAFDAVHGDRDGVFWVGQKDRKIHRKDLGGDSPAAMEEEEEGEGGLGKTSKKRYFPRYFDIYATFQYTCNLCPPDMAGLGVSLGSGGADGPPGMDLLDDFADAICRYLPTSDDSAFEDVHDCAVEVLTGEDFARAFLEGSESDVLADGTGATSA
jgi:hypothetical protein